MNQPFRKRLRDVIIDTANSSFAKGLFKELNFLKMTEFTKRPRTFISGASICILGILLACNDSVEPFEPVLGDSEFVLFINELNAGGDPTDWIEIHNPGTEMVQLEGFFIFDDHTDKYEIPSGFAIPPGGYLMFYCDGLAMGEHTNFRLSANGELIALEDPEGNVVDFVEYPEIRDGQFYGRFPDASNTLFISGVPTPEESNGASPGPALQRLNREPIVPSMEDAVAVTIEGFHQQGQITDIELFYQLDDGGYESVAMVSAGDSAYTAEIPPSLKDAVVDYYVSAVDQNGLRTNRPLGAPDSVETFIIDSSPLPQLVINEFLAINNKCCPDPDGEIKEFDDWIEIYNAGTEAIDLGGFHLSDDPLDPFGFRITDDQPEMTTIQPNGYLVLWADGDTDQGPLHLGFRLSSQGETIGLYYFDGRTIDSYQFDVQEADVSMGRSPDGSDNWAPMKDPTPGTSNG